MKKVRVYEYVKGSVNDVCGPHHLVKREKCTANFHDFGVDFEEFDNGVGTYSTAILELDDGTIETVAAEMIQFID